jgi:hypothetical protein
MLAGERKPERRGIGRRHRDQPPPAGRGDLAHDRVGVVHHEKAVARHEVHQPPERERVLLHRGEDVRVVELDVREHDVVRPVDEELGALVEEGGVVLVALDDEVPVPSRPAAE